MLSICYVFFNCDFAVAVFCPAVIATGLDRILVPLSLMSIVGLPLLDVVVKETFTAVSVNAYGILNVVFAVPACNVVVSSEAEILPICNMNSI